MIKLITMFFLTLSLSVFSSVHAAHVPQHKSQLVKPNSGSFIEKALQQKQLEKGNDRFNSSFDSLPLSAKIKVTPSQSVLAAQNQSFSRFLQSLFSSNS